MEADLINAGSRRWFERLVDLAACHKGKAWQEMGKREPHGAA